MDIGQQKKYLLQPHMQSQPSETGSFNDDLSFQSKPKRNDLNKLSYQDLDTKPFENMGIEDPETREFILKL